MPDSLNIASQQHTADMAETVGNHSFHHHHVYKPAHPGGLTDSLPAAATGLKPLPPTLLSTTVRARCPKSTTRHQPTRR